MTRRFAMACRMRPEKREEYLELHAHVWPGVEQTLRDCGVRNFTIAVRGDVLLGYFEYVGEDYAADQLRMAADPVTQQWWALTDPCQRGFDDDAPADARWQEFDEVWHLA